MFASVVELLQASVRTATVNGALTGQCNAEAPLVDLLERAATMWGLATRRFAVPGQCDQLFVTCGATADAGTDAELMLFDSHLDTVAVDAMTVAPFGGELRVGRVWGRGTCDTKASGAAMLWALREYAERTRRPRAVGVLFTVDEEVGMSGVRHFTAHDLPTLPHRPAAVIVGEPTGNLVISAHHGVVRWLITTRGLAAHSAFPARGRSAISTMVRVIDAIESRYVPTVTAGHDLCGPAACSVNMVRGGSAPNIIPDRCTCVVDRRLAPGETPEGCRAALERAIAPAVAAAADPVTIEQLIHHPPLPDDANAELATRCRAVVKAQGLPAPPLGVAFVTHASYWAAAGVPTVVLGPGETHKAHSDDEYVSVREVEVGVAVYRALMEQA